MPANKNRRYDPLSRHGMVRTARYERRRARKHDRWARTAGFADGAAADAHYLAVETRLIAELDAEAAATGTTRRSLINTMPQERMHGLLRQCHPVLAGPLFDDIDF
jgi:hypothetical protein